jgi:hypothetical protein
LPGHRAALFDDFGDAGHIASSQQCIAATDDPNVARAIAIGWLLMFADLAPPDGVLLVRYRRGSSSSQVREEFTPP